VSGGCGGAHYHLGRDRPGHHREVGLQPPPWARHGAQSENTPPDATGLLITGVETGVETGDVVTCGSFDSLPRIATWTGLSAAAPSAGYLPLPLGVKPHHPAPGLGLGASAQVGKLFHESRAPPPH